MKRENKIDKYYTDENGNIKVLIRKGAPKIRVTFFHDKTNKNAPAKTLTVAELHKLHEENQWGAMVDNENPIS